MFPPRPTRAIPSTPAPPRPTAPAPPDHYDEVNLREFGGDFDALPIPDQNVATAKALACTLNDMNYIKSALPMAHIGMQDFFLQMSKQQWQKATPFVSRLGAPMHAARGMLAIGARRDLGANPAMKDASRPLMPNGGHANDWDKIPGLERVNAYVFRGDKRSPKSIWNAGGFQPPSARTDDAYVKVIANKFADYMQKRYGQNVQEDDVVQYIKRKGQGGMVFAEYEMWRAILKGEEMNIGRMVSTDEFMRGFISTTRSVQKAFEFMKDGSADGGREPVNAVFALHSEGGFLLPQRKQHVHGTKGNECEIAHPGPIPWTKVVGFRAYKYRKFPRTRAALKMGSTSFFAKSSGGRILTGRNRCCGLWAR